MSEGIDPHSQQLGRLEGILTQVVASQTAMNGKLDGIDTRLRSTEQSMTRQGAVSGAVAGTVFSVGVALIVERAKSWLIGGGNHP